MEVVNDEDYEKLLSSKKNEQDAKDESIITSLLTEIERDGEGKKEIEDRNTDNETGTKIF